MKIEEIIEVATEVTEIIIVLDEKGSKLIKGYKKSMEEELEEEIKEKEVEKMWATGRTIIVKIKEDGGTNGINKEN